MISVIQDFFYFYKSKKSNNENLKHTFLWLISGYVLLLTFKSLFGILKIILLKNNLITSTTGLGSPDQWIAETSIYTFALQVAILAPLYEEFAFRGVIQKNKTIVKFSIIIFLFLLVCIITGTKIYKLSINSVIILSTVISIVLFINSKIIVTIQNFSERNTKSIIYLNSVLFALWHYGNYDFSKANIFTIIITFLPHFVSGLIFSWVSIRKGFFIGLILHIINNLLPVIIAFAIHK